MIYVQRCISQYFTPAVYLQNAYSVKKIVLIIIYLKESISLKKCKFEQEEVTKDFFIIQELL